MPELSIIIGLISMNLEFSLDRACTFYTGRTVGFGMTDVIYVSLNVDIVGFVGLGRDGGVCIVGQSRPM